MITFAKCQQKASSLRHHREHTRSHFLWFICPCGHASQTKEVTRRHQLREVRMEEPNAQCTHNILYTIDEDSHTEWLRATGVRLPRLPCRRPGRITPKLTTNNSRSPTPAVVVNRISTPPKGRATTERKFKIPLKPATIYNSRINKDKTTVPSQMVIESTTVRRHQKTDATRQTPKGHQPAKRRWVISKLKKLRINVVDQQVEMATTRMKLDEIIQRMEQ